MVRSSKYTVYAALVSMLIIAVFSGCAKKNVNQTVIAVDKLTFRDVPGITPGEINAI